MRQHNIAKLLGIHKVYSIAGAQLNVQSKSHPLGGLGVVVNEGNMLISVAKRLSSCRSRLRRFMFISIYLYVRHIKINAC